MPSSYPKPTQLTLFVLEKSCSKCGQVKPLAEFPQRKEGRDGHRGTCFVCYRIPGLRFYYRNHEQRKADMRARYWTIPERRRARGRRYYGVHGDDRRSAALRWKNTHPEQVRRTRRHWESANREKRRQQQRARYWANLERSRAASRAEWLRHPELFRFHARLRKLRKKGLEGKHTDLQWRALVSFYGGVCLHCGCSGPLTRDHVLPITKGGTDDIGNIQPLCASCNSSKRTRTWDYRPHHI